ncbi:MAG: hypothetical protein ACRCXT_08195, partial [Paraclostridium sp.]
DGKQLLNIFFLFRKTTPYLLTYAFGDSLNTSASCSIFPMKNLLVGQSYQKNTDKYGVLTQITNISDIPSSFNLGATPKANSLGSRDYLVWSVSYPFTTSDTPAVEGTNYIHITGFFDPYLQR